MQRHTSTNSHALVPIPPIVRFTAQKMLARFLAKEYTGKPFRLFSPSHLAMLGIETGINLSLLALRRVATPSIRRATRYSLAAVLIGNEVLWHMWNVQTGQWSIQTMLPLHVSSVMVYTSTLMLLTKNQSLYEYVYFLGTGSATQAMLTPNLTTYGFPHFRFFQTFIAHGSIITAALYMTLVEGYRPTPPSMLRVMVGTNIYMLAVGTVNAAIGSNYMFIARKPDMPTLLDHLGPWPWYIAGMEAVAVVLLLILYAPFFVQGHCIESCIKPLAML